MQIIRIPRIRTLALAAVLSWATVGSWAADTATVNGVAIPQGRFDVLLKQASGNGQQQVTQDMRNQIRDRLITFEVISQEAVKQGLDKDPDVATVLDMQRQQTLVQAFAQNYIKNHPISEDALKQEYERIKTQMAGQKEYKVRHILVKTQDEAKKVIAELKAGRSFDKLAKEKSTDPGSKDKGGNIDWVNPNNPGLVPEFAAAVAKLKKGQTTDEPVQTQFGWHVIRVDDERIVSVPSYEDAKPRLQQEMQNNALKKVVDDLRAKAKIEQ